MTDNTKKCNPAEEKALENLISAKLDNYFSSLIRLVNDKEKKTALSEENDDKLAKIASFISQKSEKVFEQEDTTLLKNFLNYHDSGFFLNFYTKIIYFF